MRLEALQGATKVGNEGQIRQIHGGRNFPTKINAGNVILVYATDF